MSGFIALKVTLLFVHDIESVQVFARYPVKLIIIVLYGCGLGGAMGVSVLFFTY